MTKKTSKIVLIAASLILALGLAACGSSDIIGTWTLTGWKIDDKVQTLEEYGISETMTIEFKKDDQAFNMYFYVPNKDYDNKEYNKKLNETIERIIKSQKKA